jgi:hypothetical protein
LDIVLTFEDKALFVVEVKKETAEGGRTGKQKGYSQWVTRECRSRDLVQIPSVLLITDAETEAYHDFQAVQWKDVCLRLRQMMPRFIKEHSHIKAAMMLAFISAVETNLLGLSAPEATQRGPHLSYGTTIRHLEKFLENANGRSD